MGCVGIEKKSSASYILAHRVDVIPVYILDCDLILNLFLFLNRSALLRDGNLAAGHRVDLKTKRLHYYSWI